VIQPLGLQADDRKRRGDPAPLSRASDRDDAGADDAGVKAVSTPA